MQFLFKSLTFKLSFKEASAGDHVVFFMICSDLKLTVIDGVKSDMIVRFTHERPYSTLETCTIHVHACTIIIFSDCDSLTSKDPSSYTASQKKWSQVLMLIRLLFTECYITSCMMWCWTYLYYHSIMTAA